jgi:hypothetical protein
MSSQEERPIARGRTWPGPPQPLAPMHCGRGNRALEAETEQAAILDGVGQSDIENVVVG